MHFWWIIAFVRFLQCIINPDIVVLADSSVYLQDDHPRRYRCGILQRSISRLMDCEGGRDH